MRVINTSIPDVKLIQPTVHTDERGFFLESYKYHDLQQDLTMKQFVQDNHSNSAPGVLRGIHYQVEQPQDKLVRVVRGEIFDVAVDLRPKSKTFGHWVGVILSEINYKMLWIPAGFGHAFYVLGYKSADVIYKVTTYWCAEAERTIRWDDPTLAIGWPITPKLKHKYPIVSDKDKQGTSFEEADL